MAIEESDVGVLDRLLAFNQPALKAARRVLVVPGLAGVDDLGVTDPVGEVFPVAGNDRPESVARVSGQLFR